MSKYEACGIYKFEVESIAAVVDIEDCITNQRKAAERNCIIHSVFSLHKRPVTYDGVACCPIYLT